MCHVITPVLCCSGVCQVITPVLCCSGVRQVITPLLAGLMEPDPARMLSYEAFFLNVQRLQAQTKMSVFHYTSATLYTLFIDPSCKSVAGPRYLHLCLLSAKGKLKIRVGWGMVTFENPQFLCRGFEGSVLMYGSRGMTGSVRVQVCGYLRQVWV